MEGWLFAGMHDVCTCVIYNRWNYYYLILLPCRFDTGLSLAKSKEEQEIKLIQITQVFVVVFTDLAINIVEISFSLI